MQQVLAKMVDTVAALLETFFGSQNNLSVQGLGAGGLGVPAEILRRMLVSPETERAMMEILPQGRDRELRQKIKIDGKGMYQPNESAEYIAKIQMPPMSRKTIKFIDLR